MKKLAITLASLLLLHGAHATGIYNTTNSVSLRFSQPWVSVAPNTVPSTDPFVGPGIGTQITTGAGAYTAHVSDFTRSSGTRFTQGERVWGSVGNSTLDQSGYSFAESTTFNLFTFDFGAAPTDFTVSVLEWAYGFKFTADAPPNHDPSGESFGGGVGYQLILDDDYRSIFYDTDVHRFYDLTGVHTFRFGTFAAIEARAIYPYKTPEGGSSLALLFISLSSLALLKFNGHRATRMARAGGKCPGRSKRQSELPSPG